MFYINAVVNTLSLYPVRVVVSFLNFFIRVVNTYSLASAICEVVGFSYVTLVFWYDSIQQQRSEILIVEKTL